MGYEVSFLALAISLLYISVTGLNPGGVIVPSYLVLFLNQPPRIAGTLAAAILTLLCFKIASRFLILFGRRRFVFMVMASAFWTLLWLRLFPGLVLGAAEFQVIGWIIPGLIANASERQGVILTGSSLVTVTVAAWVLGRMIQTVV
jgi:poly-gamma-glutamate biosynthesis protein PgsC/CapC